MRSESWFRTRRMLIFARAQDPVTVLNPSPVYPPWTPFTCNVGRIVPDSSVV